MELNAGNFCSTQQPFCVAPFESLVLIFKVVEGKMVQVGFDPSVIFFDIAPHIVQGEFPYEKIGVVSSSEMVIDGEFWGTIDWWQDKYEGAIETYLRWRRSTPLRWPEAVR